MLFTEQPPHRCPACRLVRHLCVCALAPRLATSARVVAFIHSREWKRSTNTGHLLQLALADAQIRLHGVPGEPLITADLEPSAAQAGPLLVLFPGHGDRTLTPEVVAELGGPWQGKPVSLRPTLIVPDGNWNQAKAMMRRIPLLRRATAVSLPGPAQRDLHRPRRNVFADRMSTFEAVAQALGALEGEAAEDVLLDFFRRVTDRMRHIRGRLPATEVYGGIATGEP